jgi:hypothetical protein
MKRSCLLAALVAVLLTTIALLRIVATYDVFNATSDEPAHIAAGMEWLDRGAYTYEEQHPPLARIAVALGPHLLGRHSYGHPAFRPEGLAILLDDGDYNHNLAAARAGILPFFAVAVFVVWAWARRLGGPLAAVLAVLSFTTLPLALAHSGLATTDTAVAAFVTAGVWSFSRWLESPRPGFAALVGATWSLAILSKFSALLFLPVGLAVTLALWAAVNRPWAREGDRIAVSRVVTHALLAGLVGFGLVWIGYRLSISFPARFGGSLPVPAWELARGIEVARVHNEKGHLSYLLGQTSQSGWWYFFPVAIAVKTPLPFLFFVVVGALTTLRAAWRQQAWQLAVPIVFSVAALLTTFQVNINIGLRHLLPIFPALAVLAGLGAASMWRASRAKRLAQVALAGLTLWLVIDTTRAHPDYLAYFNETVRANPERVLIDSDLDWGQDFNRLVDEVKRRGIVDIGIAVWGSVDIARQGTPGMHRLERGKEVKGWVAATELYRSGLGGPGYEWLHERQPVARIGKTIWLYYFP